MFCWLFLGSCCDGYRKIVHFIYIIVLPLADKPSSRASHSSVSKQLQARIFIEFLSFILISFRSCFLGISLPEGSMPKMPKLVFIYLFCFLRFVSFLFAFQHFLYIFVLDPSIFGMRPARALNPNCWQSFRGIFIGCAECKYVCVSCK